MLEADAVIEDEFRAAAVLSEAFDPFGGRLCLLPVAITKSAKNAHSRSVIRPRTRAALQNVVLSDAPADLGIHFVNTT